MKTRVYYEDTDVGGVVYHSKYLNFCERARSDVFYERGLTPVLEDGHFVARKIAGEFFASAKLGDILEINSEIIEIKGATFSLKQSIFRDCEKLFELEIMLVYINFENKPKKINGEIKELLLSLFH